MFIGLRRATFVAVQVAIRQLFISPGHNFFGHFQRPPGVHAIIEVPSIRCRAGRGIEGDRFFDYKPDYNGQVTFFDAAVHEQLQRAFGLQGLSAGAYRRNILTEGLDLGALEGSRFLLGDIEFEGIAESKPCHWMDHAVAPGAERWLRGRGGLRAKVCTDGALSVGAVEFRLLSGQMNWV